MVIKEPTTEKAKTGHEEGDHTSKGKEKMVVQPKLKRRRPYLNIHGSQASTTTVGSISLKL